MRNNATRNAALLILIPFVAVVSCRMVNLSELDIATNPVKNGSILAPSESLWIDFSMNVLHDSAEKCTTVKTFSGSVLFDKTWVNNRLILTPVEDWHAGLAYTLSCNGVIKTGEGLSFNVNTSVSFFVTASSTPPVLLSWIPENDTVIGRDTPIRLQFSKAIAAARLDQNIRTSPSHDISLSLADGGTSILITPVGEWDGLTRYQWSVSADLLDTEGIQLPTGCSGYFRSQMDTSPPGKPTVSAVNLLDTSVHLPLTETGNGMGLLFEFPKAIDIDSFKKSLAIEPGLTMDYRILSTAAIVAYPQDTTWTTGQKYTVTIKKDLTDTAGNKTTQEYAYTFTPFIPVLQVVSITNTPGMPKPVFTASDFLSGATLPIGINNGLLEHSFLITFSQPMTSCEAERLLSSVSLEETFPASGGNPALVFILHDPDPGSTVLLKYDDFTLPNEAAPYELVIYKFTIKGGKQGFVMDNGSQLDDDFTIYLETKKE